MMEITLPAGKGWTESGLPLDEPQEFGGLFLQ